MKHKRFDLDMFDLTDSPAREATKQYLSRKGYTAIDNPDKYCADLIIEDLCYIECECKLVWKGSRFPWPSVHLPQRKKKFAKATHNTWAVVLADGTQVKADDGESGAGMVILRMLERDEIVGEVVVVTRWYGGVHLGGDRFRHVQTCVRAYLEARV